MYWFQSSMRAQPVLPTRNVNVRIVRHARPQLLFPVLLSSIMARLFFTLRAVADPFGVHEVGGVTVFAEHDADVIHLAYRLPNESDSTPNQDGPNHERVTKEPHLTASFHSFSAA